MRFSNGGQYFAAANSNVVHLFNSYTFDSLGSLRGHSGKVKSICWSPDDSRIITCGLDGAIYEWTIKDLKRISENVQKTCLYTCAICSEDGRAIYASGSDKKLKVCLSSIFSAYR